VTLKEATLAMTVSITEKTMRKITWRLLEMEPRDLRVLKKDVRNRLHDSLPGREWAVAAMVNDFVSSAVRKREYLRLLDIFRAMKPHGSVKKPADEGLRTAMPLPGVDRLRYGGSPGAELQLVRPEGPADRED
jgi:hypothetical protein